MRVRRPGAVSLSLAAAVLASPLAAPAGAQADSAGAQYDVVVRHGRVLDGAGNPWIPADVAIASGRVVRVGVVRGKGRREIDASGATCRRAGST
jgi:N-acyl-D-amino-acid deacylase